MNKWNLPHSPFEKCYLLQVMSWLQHNSIIASHVFLISFSPSRRGFSGQSFTFYTQQSHCGAEKDNKDQLKDFVLCQNAWKMSDQRNKQSIIGSFWQQVQHCLSHCIVFTATAFLQLFTADFLHLRWTLRVGWFTQLIKDQNICCCCSRHPWDVEIQDAAKRYAEVNPCEKKCFLAHNASLLCELKTTLK